MSALPERLFAKGLVGAEEHFTLHLYGAVFRLLRYLESLGADESSKLHGDFPFLQRYAEEARAHGEPDACDGTAGLADWEDVLTGWQKKNRGWWPLRSLEEAGLGAEDVMALVLAGLPEEDSRFGTVFARLQAPLSSRLLGLELGSQIMATAEGGMRAGGALFELLVNRGFLQLKNPEAPRSEWALKTPATIWKAMRGDRLGQEEGGLRFTPLDELRSSEELFAPRELVAKIRRLPGLMESGGPRLVIVRGMDGSDRRTILGAMAREMGRNVLAIDGGEAVSRIEGWEELGPLCTLTRSLPVIQFDLGPGQTVEVPALRGYRGPVGVILGMEGGVRSPGNPGSVTLTVPATRFDQRRDQWRRCLDGQAVADLDSIAERFHLPAGHIRRVAEASMAHARLQGAPSVGLKEVRRACRELGYQRLNTLADRLETVGGWGDLVVPSPTELKLLELENRCRYRERLLDHLGSAYDAANCGVRVLFTGPSGTGKTLAAKLLASVLEKDLYRVDLASVIDKYVGETEKKLHQVLSRAEELDVMLLLDEGDSLLGSRTEVRSANDRYANLETNFLLQRLEHYQGIVVVTTTLGSQIDQAFQRRMDAVVEFARPGPDERQRIWELHLPDGHAVDFEFLREVAGRLPFTGGQIRNAASGATLRALANGGGRLGDSHLAEAIRAECRKGGVMLPVFESEREEQPGSGMEGFLHG